MLGFAASHTPHLVAIVALAVKIGSERFLREITWPALIGGGIVYLFIYVLAAAAILRGRTLWLTSPRFQAFAQYLIWAIFALAFVGRAVQAMFYVPFASVVIAALVTRLVPFQLVSPNVAADFAPSNASMSG